VIGGNAQLLAAELITDGANPTELQLLVIPKTVDNDVSLPDNGFTVGFHSARQLGLELLKASFHATNKWVIIETSGRRTGHLPFELLKESGADVAIIPEDFVGRKLELGDLCDLIEGSVLKKLTKGEVHGICLIAEGLIHQLSMASLRRMEKEGWIPREADGLELGKPNLSGAIVSDLRKRFESRDVNIQIEARPLVSELRSAAPTDFELESIQFFARAAIDGFIGGHSNCVVCRSSNGLPIYRSFRELTDPDTGRLLPRRIDVRSVEYREARSNMCIIEKSDLETPDILRALAEVGKCTEEAIVTQFGRQTRGIFGGRRASDDTM
jgi:6-phosphofructokinase 1